MVLSCIIPLYGYVIPKKIGLLRMLLELCLLRWLDGHLSHPWRPSATSLVAGGLGPWAARSSAPIFFLEISTSFAESWGVLSNFLRTPKKIFYGEYPEKSGHVQLETTWISGRSWMKHAMTFHMRQIQE